MSIKLDFTNVPTSFVGPIYFKEMNNLNEKITSIESEVPLATYETTLFHSVQRGARLTRLAKTLKTSIISNGMTRSVLFQSENTSELLKLGKFLKENISFFQKNIVSKNSRYTILIDINFKIVSNLIYIRFKFTTGEASGHNMSTFASDQISSYILKKFKDLKYISVSGNYCTDKKVSAVNSILGRGKELLAEIFLSRELVKRILRTTPEKLVELNIKKNLIGSIISGSTMSANAHYANMLLAFYIATGQDGANIVEGSQGVTHCEVINDELYFSVNIPNVIVGTIGHGKEGSSAYDTLKKINCLGNGSSEKLAHLAAATVLCGELSLLAALTNQNELTTSHKRIERINK
jgi:hydroxymethylglutaryl-CoA reductase (NADPH)